MARHDSENCQWCQDGNHVHCPTGDYPDAHVFVGNVDWVLFTKRTEDPKLAWLEAELVKRGIPSRRHGASFHAPILQVRKHDLDKAWSVLLAVDDLDDDDPRFTGSDPLCPTCGSDNVKGRPSDECETPENPSDPRLYCQDCGHHWPNLGSVQP